MGKQQKKTSRKDSIPKHAHQLRLTGKINPRLSKILAILRRRGDHTIKKIAEELEVSYDTIKRGIQRLRNEWGVRIDLDRRNHRLVLLEKVSQESKQFMIPFTEAELRVLALGAKALLVCPETGFGQTVLKIHEKLLAQVPELATSQDDEEILTFGFTSKPIYRKGIVKRILDAKQRRQQIDMYYETGPNAPLWRVVDPYGVAMVNELLYLVAYCQKSKEKRTYCLTRVWDLKLTGKTYEIPADFHMTKFLKGTFGIVGGKKRYYIVVRFDKEFAYLVRERTWEGEVKRITHPDGSFELHLKLKSLWEFERWLKGHPGKFTVLEPLELRKSICKAARAMYCNNMVEGEVESKLP